MNNNLTLSIWHLLLIFVIAKCLVVAVSLGSFYYFDDMRQLNLWNRYYSGKQILDAWYLPFANWDGQHYLLLADYGYKHGQQHNSQAFFPLYPLLIALFEQVLSVDFYVAAFGLTLLLSCACYYFFYRYVEHYLPANQRLAAVLLFLSYPTSFYLSIFYAEALFLLLLIAFLYFYDVKKSYLSLIFIALMPLTKGQALFVAIALLIILSIRYLKKETINYRYEFAQFAAFAVGSAAYFLFFYLTLGSLWSGINAQKGFVFGNSLMNVLDISHFLTYLATPEKGLFSPTHGLLDKIFIVAYLLGIWILTKSKNTLWIVFYIMLFYPVAAMGSGGSFMRFSLLAAPFFILAWLRYSEGKYQYFNYAIITLFSLTQVFFLGCFSLNLWVG